MSETIMTFGKQTFAGKIKSGGPISLVRDLLNNPLISIKVPGYDRMEFTSEGLDRIADIMEEPVPQGANPADVMDRTKSYAEDGTMSFRLSDAPRSRTLEVSPDERAEASDLFREIARRFREHVAKQDAAAEQEGSATDPE